MGGREDARAIEIESYCRRAMHSVEGYFKVEDAWLFCLFDALQRDAGVCGDLLEVGAYFGRSAILLGYLAAPSERVVVCDPFEDHSPDDGLAVQELACYDGITQAEFEADYRRFHDHGPELRVGTSDDVLPTLPPSSFRFVHIDGAHTHDVVQRDVAATRSLLGPGGIVAFDDMVDPATPGVPAAVWRAVTDDGLTPLVLTNKLYATWSAEPTVEAVRDALRASPEVEIVDEHSVAGRRFIQVQDVSDRQPEATSRRVARAITPPGLVSLGRRAQRAVRRYRPRSSEST